MTCPPGDAARCDLWFPPTKVTLEDGARPVQVLGDAAYPTGDMLAVLGAKQWTPLVKPRPMRRAVEGGFSLDDFTHDPATDTLNSGQARQDHHQDRQGGVRDRLPRLSAQGRTIQLHEHDMLQSQHCQRATEDGFQDIYRQYRRMVRASIGQLDQS